MYALQGLDALTDIGEARDFLVLNGEAGTAMLAKFVQLAHDRANNASQHDEDSSRQLLAVFRVIGNFTTGAAAHTSAVVAHGLLEMITALLAYNDAEVRRDAAWMLSNVLVDSPIYITQTVENNRLMSALIQQARALEVPVVTEAMYCVVCTW